MSGNVVYFFVQPHPKTARSLDHMGVRDDETVGGNQDARPAASFLRHDSAAAGICASLDCKRGIKNLDDCRLNLFGDRLQGDAELLERSSPRWLGRPWRRLDFLRRRCKI